MELNANAQQSTATAELLRQQLRQNGHGLRQIFDRELEANEVVKISTGRGDPIVLRASDYETLSVTIEAAAGRAS